MDSNVKWRQMGGAERELLVYEQVVIAALDCNRLEVADVCLKALIAEFPTSLRVRKLRALQLEAREKYDDAVELLDYIIKQDETNAAPRKRKVAILKAKGKISDAIKELTEYLKKYVGKIYPWPTCDIYLCIIFQQGTKTVFTLHKVLKDRSTVQVVHG
uniref:ER membrane protein complex subunit 2 n=3 Tax=Timema TaxID=61471 RepID=A0A7R9CU24_TIMPO|nr:unnamed protein product [Timema poppensis]